MQTKNNTNKLVELFDKTAQHIKELGFQVFVSTAKGDTFGYYSDGNKVAYFQQNEFRTGVNVAICNKVPGSNGGHLILEPNANPVPLASLTKAYLLKGFEEYPDYFSDEDKAMMPCQKYGSLREFLASDRAQTLVEL